MSVEKTIAGLQGLYNTIVAAEILHDDISTTVSGIALDTSSLMNINLSFEGTWTGIARVKTKLNNDGAFSQFGSDINVGDQNGANIVSIANGEKYITVDQIKVDIDGATTGALSVYLRGQKG